ncbi:uncharacterized protein LOC117649502 [Thrips palmi]|uniref:Uncharacterized protein LOC117649502 n=1 Tax=Thrips palmi TaxID=161013 RepID=A0A6P8ZSM6_THRPL|nr:uncharacterized protein LOC117649502 [Thrips palmi]
MDPSLGMKHASGGLEVAVVAARCRSVALRLARVVHEGPVLVTSRPTCQSTAPLRASCGQQPRQQKLLHQQQPPIQQEFAFALMWRCATCVFSGSKRPCQPPVLHMASTCCDSVGIPNFRIFCRLHYSRWKCVETISPLLCFGRTPCHV